MAVKIFVCVAAVLALSACMAPTTTALPVSSPVLLSIIQLIKHNAFYVNVIFLCFTVNVFLLVSIRTLRGRWCLILKLELCCSDWICRLWLLSQTPRAWPRNKAKHWTSKVSWLLSIISYAPKYCTYWEKLWQCRDECPCFIDQTFRSFSVSWSSFVWYPYEDCTALKFSWFLTKMPKQVCESYPWSVQHCHFQPGCCLRGWERPHN